MSTMVKFLTLTISLALGACSDVTVSDNGAASPEMLRGATWRLASISDADGAHTPRATLTAQFTERRVSGSAGPNNYGGIYAASSTGSIAFDSIGGTLIGGEEADTAGVYLGKMIRARRFSVTQTQLWLYATDNEHLRFERND